MVDSGTMFDRAHVRLPRRFSSRKSAELIARAALDKGLKVRKISGDIFLVEGRGRREFFDATMAGSISHLARTIVTSKDLAKLFLSRNGIPVPEGLAFPRRAVGKAVDFMARSPGSQFVLKPTNGGLGANVFMGIDGERKLREKIAATPRGFRRLLLEEQVEGPECRYFALGDEVIAVAERRPASIVGDGILTVEDLVAAKNEARKGHLALSGIALDGETLELLAEQGLAPGDVPAPGRMVRLKRVSNISQGGDSVDRTDEVHPELKALVVAALKSIPTLLYAGVDVIAEDHSAPLTGQRVAVLELNWFPMLRIHHAPAEGQPRDVAGAIIDHLFFR